MLSCVIDTNEHRYVATCDIVGAYLHTDMEEKIHMVIRDKMVDMLVAANKTKYSKHVHISKKGDKILYTLLGKALYGCLKSARLFWEHIKKVLKRLGFVLNRYDSCVANKKIEGSQYTITWHADDLKISHRDIKAVEKVILTIEEVYGKMTVTHGNIHEYVGMDFEYLRNERAVQFCMKHYLEEALQNFTGNITIKVNTAAAVHMFAVDEECQKLNKKDMEIFHSIVSKLLFVGKRARPDIMVAIAFLTTRVSKSDEDDWKKLERLMSYVNNTLDLKLTLSVES